MPSGKFTILSHFNEVYIQSSRNVKLADFKIFHSPFWNLFPHENAQVNCENIKNMKNKFKDKIRLFFTD